MVGGRQLTLETGRLAKLAHGAVLATYGESMVLVTAVSTEERPGLDFFPLTCEYVEKTYAAGKIPGGFFKREGRLRDYEVLSSRLMDRPLRPLFPDGFKKDTQVIATVLSSDRENPTDVLAMSTASAALHISDIPWSGPIAGMRVARVEGELIALPTFDQSAKADIDLIVACTKDAIVMVEGGAEEASETEIIDALYFAFNEAQKVIGLIEKIRAAVGKPKREFSVPKIDAGVASKIAGLADEKLKAACVIKEKKARYDQYGAIKKEVVAALTAELGEEAFKPIEKLVKEEIENRKAFVVREMVLNTGKRIDGRDTTTIRPISCEVGLLPRVHGSALFQRGETQAIVTATLGTASDEQKIDALTGESWKRFMLHYNFPPFSTGETKPMRGPGRREVGHGALAERAVTRLLPSHEDFPYTIRIVSEILESNGSSSMASVCGASLSLMDSGVPIKKPVAGIAMGLITENGKVAILSDILGDEDHLGDMDFKVCGTDKGIIDQTGCSVDVNDDGTVAVASADSEAVKRAIQIIEGLTAEPEVGRIYNGTIKRLVDFGAFVEILPNNEALLHVSEIAHERIENPADVLKEGDEIEVKVISVERDGKVRLTRRELVAFPEGPEGEAAKERIARAREQGGGPPRGGGGRGGDRDRGGRGGDRDRGPRRDRR
jgi:polyribonucleotide nucleotidyltransferase